MPPGFIKILIGIGILVAAGILVTIVYSIVLCCKKRKGADVVENEMQGLNPS